MNANLSTLIATLEQLLVEIQRMEQALEQEAQSLQTRDAGMLVQASKTKEELVNRINLLIQHQEAFIRTQNLPADKSTLDSILARLPQDDPQSANLRSNWQEIVRLSEVCQRRNEINGAYIGLLRQHTQRSIDILHDRSAQDLLYGSDGASLRPSPTRKLLSV